MSTFDDLVATSGGKSAWAAIQAQLNAEGASDTAILAAKDTLSGTFNTLLSNNFGIDADTAIDSAKQYTLAASTISGSIQTVTGLVSAFENASTPDEVGQAFNMFAGTMVGVAVALGAVSAGVGSVIVAAVGIVVNVLEGFLGKAPGVEVCPGVTCNPRPDWVVNCNCFWGNAASPGSTGWRKFPTDASWFVPGGMAQIKDNITGKPNATILGAKATPWGPATRPIDVLFPDYAVVTAPVPSNVAIFGYGPFHNAFISAWKANQEYAINGLKPQDDTSVLLHLLRIWNRAHTPGAGFYLNSAAPVFESSIVTSALYSNNQKTDLNNFISGTSLQIYTGPQKTFPKMTKVIPLHLSNGAPNAPSIFSSPIVKSVGVATGIGVAGTAWFAHSEGISFVSALKRLFKL